MGLQHRTGSRTERQLRRARYKPQTGQADRLKGRGRTSEFAEKKRYKKNQTGRFLSALVCGQVPDRLDIAGADNAPAEFPSRAGSMLARFTIRSYFTDVSLPAAKRREFLLFGVLFKPVVDFAQGSAVESGVLSDGKQVLIPGFFTRRSKTASIRSAGIRP